MYVHTHDRYVYACRHKSTHKYTDIHIVTFYEKKNVMVMVAVLID